MPHTVVENVIADDSVTAWMLANGAAYCHRLNATITHKTCETNRLSDRTSGNYGGARCTLLCGGLDNQTKPDTEPPIPRLTLADIDRMLDGPPVADTPAAVLPGPSAALATLDKIIDDLYTNPLDDDDFDDAELDLDDEALLALFPELEEDPWPDFPPFAEYQTEAPRLAVYRGRCIKCGGYMENTREHQDNNVFRCLACGWRTSPEYERNRNLNLLSGGML